MADIMQNSKAMKMQAESLKMAKDAQAEQKRLVEEERMKVEAIEAGQQRARRGRRGLLAFSDEPLGG